VMAMSQVSGREPDLARVMRWVERAIVVKVR
jgi:hypothetical protein